MIMENRSLPKYDSCIVRACATERQIKPSIDFVAELM